MITPMARARIYGPKPLLESATALLQELGTMHIERPAPRTGLGFRPFEAEEKGPLGLVEMETLLTRLEKILLLLPDVRGESSPPDHAFGAADPADESFTAKITELLGEAEEHHRLLKDLREERALLGKYERVIRTLAPLLEGVESSPRLELVGITVDRSGDDALPLIREALDRLTGGDFRIFTAELDRETTAAILVFGRSHSRKVRDLLFERDLPELSLPGTMADLPLKEALQGIRERLERFPKEIREATISLDTFSARWRETIALARDGVRDRIDQLVVSRRFLCSRYSFFISGWVPRRDAPLLLRRMEEKFQGQVTVEIEGRRSWPEAPVEIRNPALVRPFEAFTRLLPLPAYRSIDPAPWFAFFFPIFFGLILGDIGYGLIIMFLALFLRRRFAAGSILRDLSIVFFYSSFYVVFFGILFGEFFSTLAEPAGLLHIIGRAATGPGGEITYHPLLYDRVEAMVSFLLLALSVGVVQVLLGLLLAIVNALATGRYLRGVFKTGMLLALLSCVILILSAGLSLPGWLVWSAAIVMVLSVAGTTLIEGFTAPIEILSSLGNILSYARIMAIGLASAILGLVANRLGSLPDSVAAGIVIALFLHSVNLVLAVFSPTIHSMRLHFVEFFGKFYEPGGKPYQPFRKCGGA